VDALFNLNNERPRISKKSHFFAAGLGLSSLVKVPETT